MVIDDIWQRIEDRYGALPPQLRRAARFVRENPQDVALQSLRKLAGRAAVSPTSMTRLLQALGFDDYASFQEEHRHWLTKGRRDLFSGRADKLISDARKPGAEDDMLAAIGEAERENIAVALAPEQRRALKAAADIVVAAPAVTVLGIRSCFPVAYSLHYALSLFMPTARLMTANGGSLLDDLHCLRRDDALVVISVAPYSRETVETARYAGRTGMRVVGISDGPLTPISRLSDVALAAGNGSPAHIASPIGPLAIAQALAILVLARAGEEALAALRHREATMEATSAYLPDGA